MNNDYHTPVLLTEVLDILKPTKDKIFIDATLGGGGHTKALAKKAKAVLAVDQDTDAVKQAYAWISDYQNVTVAQGSFEKLDEIANLHNFKQVDGVLFDIGVSSHQFNQAERGFSFIKDAPLDMRMSAELGVTAKDLIAALGIKELALLFDKYGEERYAKRIARAIVAYRQTQAIETTIQLASLIEKTVGHPETGKHPATRVFQALRIAVNDELEALKKGLANAEKLTKPGGVIAVISFHSLEDRIVKQAFVALESAGTGEILTKKPILPQVKEVQHNKRARSAKLRVLKIV